MQSDERTSRYFRFGVRGCALRNDAIGLIMGITLAGGTGLLQ
jgi:hypothetical protein